MSTNKERLIAALQEPLETTLTRYKTHLDDIGISLFNQEPITYGVPKTLISD